MSCDAMPTSVLSRTVVEVKAETPSINNSKTQGGEEPTVSEGGLAAMRMKKET